MKNARYLTLGLLGLAIAAGLLLACKPKIQVNSKLRSVAFTPPFAAGLSASESGWSVTLTPNGAGSESFSVNDVNYVTSKGGEAQLSGNGSAGGIVFEAAALTYQFQFSVINDYGKRATCETREAARLLQPVIKITCDMEFNADPGNDPAEGVDPCSDQRITMGNSENQQLGFLNCMERTGGGMGPLILVKLDSKLNGKRRILSCGSTSVKDLRLPPVLYQNSKGSWDLLEYWPFRVKAGWACARLEEKFRDGIVWGDEKQGDEKLFSTSALLIQEHLYTETSRAPSFSRGEDRFIDVTDPSQGANSQEEVADREISSWIVDRKKKIDEAVNSSGDSSRYSAATKQRWSNLEIEVKRILANAGADGVTEQIWEAVSSSVAAKDASALTAALMEAYARPYPDWDY